MPKYKCRECGRLLAKAKFSRNKSRPNGIDRICKKCDAEHGRNYYYANREALSLTRRAYWEANRERLRKQSRLYYQKNRAKCLRRDREKVLANPQAKRCRNIVNSAIRYGRLKRGNCECCGKRHSESKIQAHHVDYMKPFDITWLCQGCHQILHAKLRKQTLKETL